MRKASIIELVLSFFVIIAVTFFSLSRTSEEAVVYNKRGACLLDYSVYICDYNDTSLMATVINNNKNSIESFTLYVNGATRYLPGLGSFGAYSTFLEKDVYVDNVELEPVVATGSKKTACMKTGVNVRKCET